jgi:multidrug efflux pump subunit AcrA (membrane-fusion protein)
MLHSWVKTLACAATAFAVASCGSAGGNGGRGNSNSEEPPPTAITVGKSESRDIPAFIQATGTLVADETSSIAPKTAGKVVNVGVNAGQFVSQGALIVKIDDRDAKNQLSEAQAGVKQAQVAVTQAEARIGLPPNGDFSASQVPEVRAAYANEQQMRAELKQLEANEKRYRELAETGDVSMIVYENHRTLRDVQRARVATAKEQLDAAVNIAKQSNQAVASAKAGVEAAAAQVRTAQQAVADTVVLSPFSGYISDRQVAVGEFVSTATVLATLLRTNPIKVQIQVAEADVPYVSVGRGVSVQVDAYKDRRFAGVVTAVNPAVDPVSRSALVEAQIENGDNALRPGMFATVRIIRDGGTKGVFVPKAAVHNDQATQAYRVFVIQENIAKLRTVQLGIEEEDWWQIVTGVEADEIVATSNLDQLYEGAKVTY